MKTDYDYLVFIGRFQPAHLGHFVLMREALKRARKLIVLCGAAGSARRMRNPWTAEEREAMIRAGLEAGENARVHVGGMDDYPDDADWVRAVRGEVARIIARAGDKQARVALFGHSKDETSFYLQLFPDWGLVSVGSAGEYNATAIRNAYFADDAPTPFAHPWLPAGVNAWLNDFRATPAYAWLQAEAQSIARDKALWRDAPYPVNFVTTDAVVFHRHHVLMIARKHHPGKGLWALPGGYVNVNEKLFAGCLRELQEETGLVLADSQTCLIGSAVFDTPTRSDRGRIITHAFAFHLPDHWPQPVVEGADDAEKAQWLALDALDSRQCFDDHYAIIASFRAAIDEK